MNPLKHKLANEWMRQDDATPEEALDTWNTMEAEFKLNRAMLQKPRTMAQEPRMGLDDGGRIGLDNGGSPIMDVKTRKADVGMEKISIGPSGTENVRKIVYRNRATGEEIIRYKPRVGEAKLTNPNKPQGYTTLKDASDWVDNYYKENPKKIRIKDPEKEKISKSSRRFDIKERGGVEDYKAAKEGDPFHKGHATNIKNPHLIIKPKNIIYTPKEINLAMAPKETKGNILPKTKYADLDFKIDAAENKIREIKKSNLPKAEKIKQLAVQDNKLMKYVDLSDGYKIVTLSNNKSYGEVFQGLKSMDMFNEFPNMSEKEVKEFVGEYFKLDGELKPKYKNLSKEEMLKLPQSVKDNIVKAGIFNENVKNAQKNAGQVLTGWCNKGAQRVKKDEGGRIGFGGCPDSEKITNMKNAAAKLKQHDKYLRGLVDTTPFADNAAAKELAKKVAQAGTKLAKLGRFAIGPWTLWGEPLFEAAFIAHDMLGNGTPWKEAVAKSIWAKPAIAMGLLKPADQQYEEALWQVQDEKGKALLKKDQTMAAPGAPMELRTRTGVKRFIDNNKKMDKLNKLYKLKQTSYIMGPKAFSQDERAAKMKKADETYNNYLESLGGAEGVKEIDRQIEKDRETHEDRVAALKIKREGWDDPEYEPSFKHERLEEPTKEMQDLMYQKYGKEWAGPSVGIKGTPGEFKKKWIIDPKILEVEKEEWNETKTYLDKMLKQHGDEYGYGWTPYGLGYGMQQMKPGIGDKKYNKDLGYRQLLNYLNRMASGGRAGYTNGGLTRTVAPDSEGIMSLKKKR
jgi:hypothetical protein